MYDIEKYYQAESVEDAVRALGEAPEAVVIAGGSDVLIKIREGKLAGCSLVSIHGLKELEGVSMEENGTLTIGPCTSFSALTKHEIVKRCIPILGNAVDQAGGPQLRNVGTIGGNICNGVTSADSAPSLLVLNAMLKLQGGKGTRRVPITEFYTGPGKTVRAHDELLTEIRIAKKDYEGFGGAYLKYGKRNAMEISTLGCAVGIKPDAAGRTVSDIRIACGVAAPVPIRLYRTEEALRGMPLSRELFTVAREKALEEIKPRSSWRASREFRIRIAGELLERAMLQAVQNAGGEIHA